MPLLPELDGGWDDVIGLIDANCTLTFKAPNGTTTADPETGNVIFSQRTITLRAHVVEENNEQNRFIFNDIIGSDKTTKQMIGRVASVDDSENPTWPNHLMPSSILDFSTCRMEFDSPTGLQRTGSGYIRLSGLDIYGVHEVLGERFSIAFTPDKLRVTP